MPHKKVPEAVTKTFRGTFPQGNIFKLDAEEENNVTVYDIEFRDGGSEKETDIAADGTMLELTVVIDAKAIPTARLDRSRAEDRGWSMPGASSKEMTPRANCSALGRYRVYAAD